MAATLNLGVLGFNLSLNKQGWNQAWKEAGGDMEAQGNKIQQFASKIGTTLKVGVAVGAAAAGAAIIAMTKAGIENAKILEKSMSDYQAHTGSTGEETAKVKDLVKDLYKTNTNSYEELAATAEAMHNAMGMGAEDIKKYEQDYLNYAKVTGQAPTEAVAAIDDLGDAWDLTADQQVGAMDMMLMMQQKYGASVTDTQAALTKMAPAAKAAGFTMEQSAAMLAMFAASGVDANTAATAMTKALGKVKSPEQLKKLMKDIENTEDPFKRAQKASELFGTKAGPQMAQALANGSVSIDDFVAQMGAADGAVQKAADTINSDFGTRMELMNKKFGAMGTEIGEKLLPVMELLMGWVEQHMPEIEAAVSVVFDAIGQAINWFVSNVWPGLSAALNAIWGVFQKIWPPISVLIQKVFGIISTVFKAVGALLKGDWSGAWKYFQEYVAGVLDLWRTAIEDAWNAIDNLTGGALTRIKDWVVGAWEAIAAKTTEIWTGITDWFNSTFGWIGQLFSGLDWSLPTITMPEWVQNVLGTISGWWHKVKTWFSGITWSLPTITMPEWVQNVLGTISGWWDKVKSWFTGLNWSLPDLSLPVSGQQIIDTVQGWADNALTWFKGLSFSLPGVEQPVTGKAIVDTVQGWADSALNWFKGLSFSLPGVEQPVTGKAIVDTVQGWADNALNWFKGLTFQLPTVEQPLTGEAIVTRVQGWANDALNWFRGLSFQIPGVEQPVTGEAIVTRVQGWANDALNWFQGLSFQIPGVEQPVTGEAIITRVQGWADSALTWFKGLSWGLPDLSMPEGQNVVDTINGWAEKAKNWFVGLNWSLPAIDFGSILTSAKSTVDTWIANLLSAFNFHIAFPTIDLPDLDKIIKEIVDKIKSIHIPTPHFTTTWYNGPMGISLPSFSVSWYRLGGVFTQPTLLAGVGEAGDEAVLPLSTLWAEMSARFDRALAMRDYASAESFDYMRIERAFRRNPVMLLIDGKEMATTMVDRNEVATGGREYDIAYGMGG